MRRAPERCALPLVHLAAVLLISAAVPARGAGIAVTIALDFSLTGADADSAARMRDGALLAIEQANASGGAMRIDPLVMDDGSVGAGQSDPAAAATNAHKMVSDPAVVAAVGPQTSAAAKAMAPLLNEAGLPIVSPAASGPDLAAPRFADRYRPSGRLTFFRTVANDPAQGTQLANYLAETLHVRTAYVLDDAGTYGVGLADAFAAQAVRKGIKLLGRDKVDPGADTDASVFARIKALNPDALYFGGVFAAGLKVVRQAAVSVPKAIKAGGDGLYGPELLTAAGFPAAEGWYVTTGAAHPHNDRQALQFAQQYTARFARPPDDYARAAYDAGRVVTAAIAAVAGAGKPVTRDAVRAAIARIRTDSLQGEIQFDASGELKAEPVSIFQARKDARQPLDDMDAQLRYVTAAPQR